MSLTITANGSNVPVLFPLPPVDSGGNVPFPYGQLSPGKTIFAVKAGGVLVTFTVDFI